METKTHWKKQFNYDYLGSYSLVPGEDLILTIKETKKEMVTGTSGSKEQLFVCHFVEGAKPMIMNRTNCKVIEKLYTPFIEDWKGKQIQVYSENVKAFGEIVEALRVKPVIPNAKKPELKPNTDIWEKAKAHLANGGKIGDIKNKYELSQTNEEKLCTI